MVDIEDRCTGLAYLWIGNDESIYRFATERAQDCVFRYGKLDAAPWLEDEIREYFEDNMPESTGIASLYTDLLNVAFGEIDWRKIAESYVDEVDESEPECLCCHEIATVIDEHGDHLCDEHNEYFHGDPALDADGASEPDQSVAESVPIIGVTECMCCREIATVIDEDGDPLCDDHNEHFHGHPDEDPDLEPATAEGFGVLESDPELERLLAEEEEIERRAWHVGDNAKLIHIEAQETPLIADGKEWYTERLNGAIVKVVKVGHSMVEVALYPEFQDRWPVSTGFSVGIEHLERV